MPEAVIVSTARSPIGRAFKGSLKDLRPDDITATIIQAALAKVPELDPRDIDDLMLGCGLPGGEQGNNLGRIVAVQMGMDHLPGCTVTRYCSSSLQTSRMALHAIKAERGRRVHLGRCRDGLPLHQGQLRQPPGHAQPLLRRGRGPHRRRRPAGGHDLARPARGRPRPGRLHRDGPDGREPRPLQGRHPPGHGRVRRPLAEPRRGSHQERLLGARDHPGDAARRHGRLQGRRPARRLSPSRASRA